MEVQAVYKHGRVQFLQPIEVAQDEIPVTITFPEGSVVARPESAARQQPPAGSIQAAVADVLAPVQDKLAAARQLRDQTPAARTVWHQHLQEKYVERK